MQNPTCRSVCMEASGIYIIMVRLSRITGMKRAKIYDNYSPKWDVSSMSQTTQIELEQKYFIFHILCIQNAP